MPIQDVQLPDPFGPADTPAGAVHVVVLAAGRGSRMGTLGDTTPKWLLEVGGRTIAERQLEGISRAGAAVASARVVVGHAPDPITALLADHAKPVGTVPNPDFDAINNWLSVLLALRELPEDGPVLVMNADLAIAADDVAAFIGAAASGGPDAMLAVDVRRTLTDESMKVSRNADGTLARIGKVGIDDAAGEYIGMLVARGPVLRAFRAVLESFVGRDECANEWYEGAVGRTAAEGVAWHVWPTPSSDWVEIDDDADLALAERLVGHR